MSETERNGGMRKSTIILASAGLVGFVLLGAGAVWTARTVVAYTTSATKKIVSTPSGTNAVIKFVRDPAAAPAFQVNDLTGQSVSPTAFPGKVVLLSFWATWCPPCRREIPELIQLQAKYKDRLQIIGLSEDDNDAPADVQKVRDFAGKFGMNYPVVMADKKLIDEYGGVPALPTVFVLDTKGRVVQKHAGFESTNIYENEVRSLLGLPVNAKVETFEDTGQVFLTNASKATELPDVDFTGLSADQKREALKRMNSESCTCGCDLTIAECRMNDTSCDVSKTMAAKIVKEVAAGKSHPEKTVQP